jgi:hypothetical protein
MGWKAMILALLKNLLESFLKTQQPAEAEKLKAVIAEAEKLDDAPMRAAAVGDHDPAACFLDLARMNFEAGVKALQHAGHHAK